jgi:hypothetical protein
MTRSLASPGRFPLSRVVLVWAAIAAMLLLAGLTDIAAREFHDPDDILRLVQVRDLLAGQGWFDLHQYRIDPPHGTLMHWSRLVDAPLALVIGALTPLLGQHAAETVALVAVPLLTLGTIVFAVARVAARVLDGAEGVTLACLCLGISPLLLNQVAPLRIDHHGWQIAAVAWALVGLLPGRPVRGAALSGAALAVGLSISLEVLPITVAFGGVFALRWLADGRTRAPLVAFLAVLAGALVLLFLATRGFADLAAHCDSTSPPYLGAIALAALGVGGVAWLQPRSRLVLVGLLGLAGAAAGGLYLWSAPQCTSGPFSALDPLVRAFWYDHVLEGQPGWRFPPEAWIPVAVQSVVVVMALAWLWRNAAGETRRWWFDYLLVFAASFVTALLVWRSMAFVMALSAVPLAWLAQRLLAAMRRAGPPVRKLAVALALIVLLMPPFPVMAAKIAMAAAGDVPEPPTSQTATKACSIPDVAAALDRLPPATLFAPIDLGPNLLERTHHSVVATGHHRAQAALHDLIAGFLGTSDEAHAMIRKHGAHYVVICTDLAETGHYRKRAPNGFAASLEKGRAPAWLEPVAIDGPAAFKIWRVRR